MKKLLIICLCLNLLNKAYSSHLIGGELYYTKLGTNTYLLEFKAYRDCINGLIGFDDPLAVSVFTNNTNSYLGFFAIPFNFAETLPLKPVTPCAGLPDNVCVEETKYSAVVELPPSPSGYKLVYQRCCRNQTIQNILEPELTGTTYFVTIFGNDSPYFENSSPRFNNFPPIFLCVNEKFEFDHSATDPNGDSLVYELVTPWVGGDTSGLRARPLPAGVPPFQEVKWRNPYNLQNPMGGSDPIRIDRNTGLLHGTPPSIGQFVLGVAVSEYRNGRLIQRHIRDFQFNVVDCPPPPTAVLPDIINNCGILTVFANNSVSATNFLWDFGDPTATNDFSTERTPRYVYPSPGEYDVRLIVSDNRPECADTAYAKVIIIKNPEGANFNTTPVCLNVPANFRDNTIFDVGTPVRWTWELEGRTINEPNGNLNYRFSNPGTFNVRMVAFNEAGCSDTIAKPITIYPLPQTNLKSRDTICLGDSKRIQVATDASVFNWLSAPELSCNPTCLQPLFTPNAMGLKSFVFSATSVNSCIKADTITIFTPFIRADAGKDTTVCPEKTGILLGNGGLKYFWRPSSFVVCDTCKTTQTLNKTDQTFVLEVRDQFNCKDLDSVLVNFLPKAQFNVSNDTAVCEGSRAFLRVNGNVKARWTPRFGVSCDTCLTVQTVPLSENQTFFLNLIDENRCDYKDTVKVDVNKNNLRISPDTTVCYGISANLRASGSRFYRWSPTVALSCDTCSRVLATPLSNQLYQVTAIDENNCEFSKQVRVNVRRIIPEAKIENNAQRCFGTPIEFKAIVENFDRVCLGNLKLQWDFGDGIGKDTASLVNYVYEKEGEYEIKLFVNGKDVPVLKDLRIYEPDSCLKNIYIPNTFTPNKDGNNDLLFVRGLNIIDLLFNVYNNWGEEVFSTKDIRTGWDGTFKGVDLKSQTLVFTCEATFYDGSKVFKEGNVTLLR